jgi:hypothetical protein
MKQVVIHCRNKELLLSIKSMDLLYSLWKKYRNFSLEKLKEIDSLHFNV